MKRWILREVSIGHVQDEKGAENVRQAPETHAKMNKVLEMQAKIQQVMGNT